MELEVYWSQLAQEKLEDIFNYYKQKADSKTARKIISGIVSHTINLNKNPDIGQIEEFLKEQDKNFRYLIYTNYKIIYWVNNNKQRLEIAAIYDTRQNPIKLYTK
jgi:plasmid stabilization system protein ParE